jgi:C4-dicarboxylate-specific signal transduction histidine kinase
MTKRIAVAALETKPPAWPNRVVDADLPPGIEQCLQQAHERMLSAREEAVALLEQAIAMGRDAANTDLLARTLFQAVPIMRGAMRPDRAFALSIEAQQLLERLDERWHVWFLLIEQGSCYLSVGEHERALELFSTAADRFEQAGDRPQVGRCYTLMAQAHALAGDLRKAVDDAVKSLECLDPDNTADTIRRQLHNNEAYWRWLLGKQHEENGQTALAQQEYDHAAHTLSGIEIIDPKRWDLYSGRIFDTMASVYLAKGNAERARMAVSQLAIWARRWKSPKEKALAWLQLADLRKMQNKPQRAIVCTRRAVFQLGNLPSAPQIVQAHLQLAELLEDTGDVQAAYDAHVRAGEIEAQQLKESIAMRAELLALDSEAERELRKTEQTLAYAQRLSNVGQTVASITHELNQPMASIKMLADTTIDLLDSGNSQEIDDSIAAMQKLGERLSELTNQLAAFPARTDAEVSDVEIGVVVADALAALGSRLARTPCEIEQIGCQQKVKAVESQLVRVVTNVLNNALDAMEKQTHRHVRIAAHPIDASVAISIADCGPGLLDETVDRLFQPFFSTKAPGKGLGLGLALSREAVQDMSGELAVGNRPEGGAVITITLPAA